MKIALYSTFFWGEILVASYFAYQGDAWLSAICAACACYWGLRTSVEIVTTK